MTEAQIDKIVNILEEAGVLSDIMENLGFEPNEASDDEEEKKMIRRICEMGTHEMFERYLNWNGIIGFADSIYRAVHAIDEAQKVKNANS